MQIVKFRSFDIVIANVGGWCVDGEAERRNRGNIYLLNLYLCEYNYSYCCNK